MKGAKGGRPNLRWCALTPIAACTWTTANMALMKPNTLVRCVVEHVCAVTASCVEQRNPPRPLGLAFRQIAPGVEFFDPLVFRHRNAVDEARVHARDAIHLLL